MSCYRLYLMTDAGHIRDRQDLDADSDRDALAAVGRMPGSRAHELWCGVRLVHESDIRIRGDRPKGE